MKTKAEITALANAAHEKSFKGMPKTWPHVTELYIEGYIEGRKDLAKTVLAVMRSGPVIASGDSKLYADALEMMFRKTGILSGK